MRIVAGLGLLLVLPLHALGAQEPAGAVVTRASLLNGGPVVVLVKALRMSRNVSLTSAVVVRMVMADRRRDSNARTRSSQPRPAVTAKAPT